MKNKIASFGEIVWDCFGDSKTLGGAPLNFAYFCAKFGCDSAIISAVGNDGLGRAALAKIAEIRLDARAVAVLPDLPTGIVDVSEGSDGLPAYNIRRPAAWDEIGLSEAAAEIAAGCGAFCFGTLAQRSETSRKTLFALLETLKPSCLKVFDANLRQNYFDAKISRRIPRICGHAQAQRLGASRRPRGFSSAANARSCARWRRKSPRNFR